MINSLRIERWDDVMDFSEDMEGAFVDEVEKYSHFDVYKMVIDYVQDTSGDFDELPNPDCITVEIGRWSGDGGDEYREFTPDKKGRACYFIDLVKSKPNEKQE